MAISSAGIGSGLDVNSIISQLMEIERQPLLKLEQKEAAVHAEISAYGSLKAALSELQSSISNLMETDTFGAMKATSSDTSIFTATASTSAVASSYSVTVNRLAQQHKLGSAEFADTATFGANGDQLTITSGSNSFNLNFTAAMTLSEIQAAINVDSNDTGVSAGIITGDSGNQTLVLTSGESGYDNRVQLTFSGTINPDPFSFSTINRDSNGTLLSADTELDASLLVDGVSVTRSSNSISDVVEGLTLSLAATGSAQVSIGQDTSSVTTAINSFITAFNSLETTMAGLPSSGLNSSSMLRTIETQIRSLLNGSSGGLGSSFSYISELGVTTKEGGGLQLDSTMLTFGLENYLSSVTSFFSDSDNGFAVKLDSMLEGFIESGGTIDQIVETANNQISSLVMSQESMSYRLSVTEARLRDQFTALDTLMAQMTTTSDYLTSQLAGLDKLFLSRDS